jgi:hypothetical protein
MTTQTTIRLCNRKHGLLWRRWRVPYKRKQKILCSSLTAGVLSQKGSIYFTYSYIQPESFTECPRKAWQKRNKIIIRRVKSSGIQRYMFLRNVGWHPTDYMALYRRRTYSSQPPLENLKSYKDNNLHTEKYLLYKRVLAVQQHKTQNSVFLSPSKFQCEHR